MQQISTWTKSLLFVQSKSTAAWNTAAFNEISRESRALGKLTRCRNRPLLRFQIQIITLFSLLIMSKRSNIMDDKTISEMILKNITTASQMNIEMSDILNIGQMRLLTTYKETYNYQPCLSFFLSLGIMSHFSQGSYYTHYASSDRRPVQLYLWLLGASGTFR